MNRFIANYDPKDITVEFLGSHDWDIIELPITVDQGKLLEWYDHVTKTYANLEFSFFNNPYIKEQYAPATADALYGYNNRIYGRVASWGLDWPAETDLPIPPPFAAKEEYYPELSKKLPYQIQKKYLVGYFKTLVDALGAEAFTQSRITHHYPGAGILGHTDGKDTCLRVHIPIVTHSGSQFLYGDNLERSYTFELGKVYLINASVWHATVNDGAIRSHIISDPHIETVLRLVNTKVAL